MSEHESSKSGRRLSDAPEPLFYRPRRCAELTGLALPTIYKAIYEGKLTALRKGKAVLVPVAAFERWIGEAA